MYRFVRVMYRFGRVMYRFGLGIVPFFGGVKERFDLNDVQVWFGY